MNLRQNRNQPKFTNRAIDKYADQLKALEMSQLMLTAMLLHRRHPRSLPNNKNELTNICLAELGKTEVNERQEILTNILNGVKDAPSTDSSAWIKTPIHPRLEALLRRRVNKIWIDVENTNDKQRFLLTYNYEFLTNKLSPTLTELEKEWQQLSTLNELDWLKKDDTTEFLKYFYNEHKKYKIDRNTNQPIFNENQESRSHVFTTAIDGLIWLDSFSPSKELRKSVVKKARALWKQAKDRKTSEKKQKNFSLQADVCEMLNKLSKEYGLTETKIIETLIKNETESEIYLSQLNTSK